MTTVPDISAGIRVLLDTYEDAQKFPFGPPAADPQLQQVAGHACVTLCNGDQDKARSLWKLVVQDCGGYLPRAAAMALSWGARPTALQALRARPYRGLAALS